MKTSDSDFSDSEGGRVARLNGLKARIRQAALQIFSHIIKVCTNLNFQCLFLISSHLFSNVPCYRKPCDFFLGITNVGKMDGISYLNVFQTGVKSRVALESETFCYYLLLL